MLSHVVGRLHLSWETPVKLLSLAFKPSAGRLYSLGAPTTRLRADNPSRLTPEGAFPFPSSRGFPRASRGVQVQAPPAQGVSPGACRAGATRADVPYAPPRASGAAGLSASL